MAKEIFLLLIPYNPTVLTALVCGWRMPHPPVCAACKPVPRPAHIRRSIPSSATHPAMDDNMSHMTSHGVNRPCLVISCHLCTQVSQIVLEVSGAAGAWVFSGGHKQLSDTL